MGKSLDIQKLQTLIAEAKASGGTERSNYQIFVNQLCSALGLESPTFSKAEDASNNYVFERRIRFNHPDGSSTPGWIDCYKRGAFILEAKQSKKRQRKIEEQSRNQLSFLPEDRLAKKRDIPKRGWDQIMLSARRQAEDYAKALPIDHGYPPFLLIVDVGHVIEVYADFSGQGKNYAHFPDRQNFRVSMDDLLDEKIQHRLISIWTDALSLDPNRISAEVTKDVAERLAKIASTLEKRHDAKDVAEFLMRCLFTMFAEDAKLIPDKGFEKLLGQLKETPQNFVPALENLWKTMNEGGYAPHLNATLKKFNGGLFSQNHALPLEADQIAELYKAAGRDWKNVEPAIFGTLLERALEQSDRSKLGAHYTPRTYVERLVIPTIIEPLRQDWQEVQNLAELNLQEGKDAKALDAVLAFHRKLCTTRVLDPACGTGNFLYVSFELMKKLEGEVLGAIADLGGTPSRYQDFPEETLGVMKGQRLARNRGRFSVGPQQFYGLEINPRAAIIADLVLWIGYLKWQIATSGLDSIYEPVLDAYGTIKEQDAILKYDKQELLKDENGKPLSRWDGITKKLHPITGEEIPDPEAQLPLYKYVNPRGVQWPEAEFIVGNPPFIGNKRMIQRLGEEYVETLRRCYIDVPDSVDFVMYWWWHASQAVASQRTRRFGLVTTNKITQVFNRRMVERFLHLEDECSLVFAISDHPWTDEGTTAAVRVSMTVGQYGAYTGKVLTLIGNEGEEPFRFLESKGVITQKLTASDIPLRATRLMANEGIAHQGVIPVGEGFRIEASEAVQISREDQRSTEVIKPYKIGRDLLQRDQGMYIIDLYGHDWSSVVTEHPRVAQIVLNRVKPQRDANRRPRRRERFWLYADSCEEMRNGLSGLERYIATCRTAKHRVFSFLEGNVLPDAKIVAITDSSSQMLSLLSSRIHVLFSISHGGWQGAGNDPVYQHSDTFNPFPFSPSKKVEAKLSKLGERLDSFRKERLAIHNFLTMTGLYNALERLREIENSCDVEPLSPTERDVHNAGLISVLKEIHDDIDRTVLNVYGWDDLAPAIIGKPGGLVPSEHKSEEQLVAEEELLRRLTTLNYERAEEEKKGNIRWLRPDYQVPKLGLKAIKFKTEELDLEVVETVSKPKWPGDGLAQIRLVRDVLAKAAAPASPIAISAAFDGRNTSARKDRVAKVLETMVVTGAARAASEGAEPRYFIIR